MCGIIGYIGSQQASSILIAGLASLEYRGYDSAGVALFDRDRISVLKQAGRVAALQTLLAGAGGEARGCVGIGHTRWATHGKPSQANAHPHLSRSGEIAVVHNGIIENYQSLRDTLISQGFPFVSETDTEVIPHLIERELGRSQSLEEAVLRVTRLLKGSFAFVVIGSRYPDRLIGVRRGSPLIAGLGSDGGFFASDIPALLNRCDRVCYLEDKQMSVLTHDRLEVFQGTGRPAKTQFLPIQARVDAAERGGYDHYMLKEIFEQPDVLRRMLENRLDADDQPHFDELQLSDAFLRRVEKIFIVSCGTAYHAGYVGKYLLEEFTEIPVEIDISSEFRYRKKRLGPRSLLLCISQSGETADTLACVREAREARCPILSVCNVVSSSIARESNGVIYTEAGPEIGVASTKAYTSQLAVLTLLAIRLAKLRGQINDLSARTLISELRLLPGKIAELLADTANVRAVARRHHKAVSALYLGRGINFPTALEGALKNKEISYMHCEGYPAGEMKHGPIALINPKLPVICVCTNGQAYDKMLSNVREVEARDGILIAVATRGNTGIRQYAREVLEVPETLEELSPILNIIPLQLLAYYIALEKGCDIDKPRNLAKSVTVE